MISAESCFSTCTFKFFNKSGGFLKNTLFSDPVLQVKRVYSWCLLCRMFYSQNLNDASLIQYTIKDNVIRMHYQFT